ncbi:MAG: HpsJ family protein [Prochloraceae cyanobacterium]|nr:HpsJ family protein [Prochloraceae cyanobacterium]
MLNSLKQRPKQSSESQDSLAERERERAKIINLVGYVFVILTLLDLGYLLIHPQFFNPQWEMRTIGKAIETVWAILLGFLLIFHLPETTSIKPQKFKQLSRLSWLAFAIGIIYLLMIPMLGNNARIIAKNNRAQSIQLIERKTLQFKQFEQKLSGTSNANLAQFLQFKESDKMTIKSPEKLRKKLIKDVRGKREKIENQLKKQLLIKQKNLIKVTLKWTIGAIISGVSFIMMWKWTKWIRLAVVRGDRS